MTQNTNAPGESRDRTDIVIVGAGPIGVELAVALRRKGVDFEIFEAGPVGHTISWWPPQTRWFSSNDRIAIAGVPLVTPDQAKATREQYLAYLRGIVTQFDITVHCFRRVVDIQSRPDGFVVVIGSGDSRSVVRCRAVILAVGGMDRPRRLGIDGEDLPHVDGYLREPHRYFGRKVLIIGGRNSAVEAVLRLHHAGAVVSLSYRGEQLPQEDIKYWLYPEIRGLIRDGRVTAYFGTRPTRITSTHVQLESADAARHAQPRLIVADDVLALIGYEQDKRLFERAGIELLDAAQRPRVDPHTMETSVPGIYVAGTAVAGTQSSRFTTFLENCHAHVDKIVAHLTGSSATPRDANFQRQIEAAPES